MTDAKDDIWSGAYKIPWHEPDFSRRMLREHLSQEHDLASRRCAWIDKQVAWIHEQVLGQAPSRVLDLGCGPGLYSHRLAKLGHRCQGVDFGPASIEYARQQAPKASSCDFILGDLREGDYGGPFDLAMILYGELNVFSPAEAQAILGKVRACLATRGRVIIELQTPEAVERVARGEPVVRDSTVGLFSDQPHRVVTEGRWLADEQVGVQTFTVTDAAGGPARSYRSTTKAWRQDEFVGLLNEAGFGPTVRRSDWPCNTDDLALWIGSAGEEKGSGTFSEYRE